MQSLRGHFLVASNDLQDSNFFRTVVLIVQHSHEGALGLVVNRPTSRSLSEVWTQAAEHELPRDYGISIGGPCNGPLMAVHALERDLGVEVIEPLRFTGEGDELLDLMQSGGDRVRLFLGYAGWSSNQLESEISQGSWGIVAADPKFVFDPHDAWTELWRQVFGLDLPEVLGIRHVPPDLSQN